MGYGISYGEAENGVVTADDLLDQCRLGRDWPGDVNALLGMARAARDLAERHTGRRLVRRSATLTLDAFPGGDGVVRLPVEPVRAVTAVRYRDSAGALTTLAESAYQTALGFSPPLLAPAAGTCWPATQCGRLGAVEIDLTVGPEVVPPAAKQAVMLAVGYWYAHRGDGGDPEKDGLPPAAVRLLNLLDTGGYR